MVWTSANGSKCPVSPADRGEFMKPRCPTCKRTDAEHRCMEIQVCSDGWHLDANDRKPASVSTPAQDKFKRTYAVEIEFDTPFDFAEQDRLACVVLEKLVDEWWENAQEGTQQANVPIRVIAYPIPNQGR